MSREEWCSEYGADTFSVGSLGESDGGEIENHELLNKWWPLYVDDAQVGWVQLVYNGSTCFGIRAMPGSTVEIRTEGAPADPVCNDCEDCSCDKDGDGKDEGG